MIWCRRGTRVVTRGLISFASLILVAETAALSTATAQEDRSESVVARRGYPAILMPDRTALMKSKYSERVAEVKVRISARVRQGQLLVRLVDIEQRLARDRAAAVRDQSQLEFDRMRRLHEMETVADELLDSAETELRIAQADLDLAEFLLEERSIRAPFDGVVAERYVDPGTSVEEGDPLLRVTALTPLRLEVLLPQEVLPRLVELRQVKVTLTAPRTTLQLPLKLGPVVVDPASGTFPVEIEVDNRDGRLIPGVSAWVEIP